MQECLHATIFGYSWCAFVFSRMCACTCSNVYSTRVHLISQVVKHLANLQLFLAIIHKIMWSDDLDPSCEASGYVLVSEPQWFGPLRVFFWSWWKRSFLLFPAWFIKRLLEALCYCWPHWMKSVCDGSSNHLPFPKQFPWNALWNKLSV